MRALLAFRLLPALALLAGCETSPRSSSAPSPDPARQTAGQPAARPNPEATAQATAAPPAAARKTYGEPLTAGVETVALHDLLQKPGRYADKTIRTEGTVSAVCQGRGCWLEIGDDRSQAHVKLGNHKFFVPRSSSGQHAVVQARVMPQVDKGHCEQEAEEQTGQVAKVELEATGVELSPGP